MNIYQKTMYEWTEKGFIIFHRKIIGGHFTNDVTEFMGLAMLTMNFPNAQAEVVQREFSINPDIPMIDEYNITIAIDSCFKKFEETLRESLPIIQKKLEHEMLEQARQQSRILRTDRQAPGQHGFRK